MQESRVLVPATQLYSLYYRTYNYNGDQQSEPLPLICVHGIAGNCTDFEYLGKAISDFPIISPDIPGRGKSDWLNDTSLYCYSTYCSSVLHLVRLLKIRRFNFLGTSMGGIVGMLLAARFPQMFNKLILNDVGPYMGGKPLNHIVQYMLQSPTFDTVCQAETYLKHAFRSFAIKTQEHWNHVVSNSIVATKHGYVLSVDPKIGIALNLEVQKIKYMDIWDVWDKIQCNVFVIKGEYSNILTTDIVNRMKSSGKVVQVDMYRGAGHAPALFTRDIIGKIEYWVKKC